VGQTLVIDYRAAAFNEELLRAHAEELVARKVDVIVTIGTRSALVAREVTSSVPIVFPAVADPLAAGLVKSLRRPEGNATGLAFMAPELGGKRLELLKEALPRAARVAVVWNPGNAAVDREWRAVQAAAPKLGVTLLPHPLRSVSDLDGALKTIVDQRPGGLLVFADPMTSSLRPFIIEFAARKRLPAMYGWREFVDSGGLMAYGARMPDLFRRAAVYVDKILKGARPADLPVEQATEFELVISLKTARAMGLVLPRALLARADRLVE